MIKKTSQKTLLKKVEKNIVKNKLIESGDLVVVAVSGGMDSVCLLDILDKLSTKLSFRLALCHYNHKLRGDESDRDERFVIKLAKERGRELNLSERKKERCKSEDEARGLRYNFFEKIIQTSRGAKIAIAHNSSDLSETLLMRLLRGSGIKGLKSIPLRRKNFIRPLLPFSRTEIEKYVTKNNLRHVVDKTNKDEKFLRNYIRKNVISKLRVKNPRFDQAMFSLSESVERDYDYIERQVDKEFKKLAKVSLKRVELGRKKFVLLHPAVKYHLLLRATKELKVEKDIGSIHLNEAMLMIEKNVGKKKMSLPHSLLIELNGDKIIVSRG